MNLRYVQIFVAVLFYAAMPAAEAQVFWSETFSNEGAAVLNWKNSGTNPGLSDWNWTDDPAAGYQDTDLSAFAAPTATGGYFYFDSHGNGVVSHDVTLTGAGRPAKASGKTAVRLRFFTQYVYFNTEGAEAWIGVSTDSLHFTYKPLFAGLPPNLPYHDWVDIDLGEADHAPRVWLRFRWAGRYEYHWKIDDLQLYRIYTPNPDSCETAVDITAFFDPAPGVARTTGLFDNTAATVSETDPEVYCWSEAGPGGADILNNTLWFTFTGNGGVYDIQTVPCNAAAYIGEAQGNKGDTQMLVYTGDNCTDLTPVLCNDDLFPSGQPDFRAGLTLETIQDRNYFLLIDGFDNQGVVASGQFCIQIVRKAEVACNAGKAGAFALANGGYVCAGENLLDLISLDTAAFSLPTVGPESGLAWCFTDSLIPQGLWPGDIPGVAGTPFSRQLTAPSLLNNGQSLDYGVYYLTPVVLGGGVLTNPGALPYVFNIDPSGGCYFLGASLRLTLLPPLFALSASAVISPETLPAGNNGGIALTAVGGAAAALNDTALYRFNWSNGANERVLTGLSAGIYTVTISDASGCTAPLIQSYAVPLKTTDTDDPPNVRSLTLAPNPAGNASVLRLVLDAPATVEVEIWEKSGKRLTYRNAGAVQSFETILPLEQLAPGVYLVKLQIDGAPAWRRLVKL